MKTEPDGDVVTVNSDGSWTKRENDGDTVTVNSDGSFVMIEDGAPSHDRPDVSELPAKPNQNATTPKTPVQPR